MTPLRQRMLEDMQLRALSPRTQEAYIRAIRQLAEMGTGMDWEWLLLGRGWSWPQPLQGVMSAASLVLAICIGLGVTVLPVELPYHTGPEACLHLLSLISIVDDRLAVIYPPLLAVPFWQSLVERGFHFVEVPAQEFETMGTNVLALSPGRCVMLEGNPVTQRRLEAAGCQVLTYRGNEISLKAEGGPTCLTRPILRAEG